MPEQTWLLDLYEQYRRPLFLTAWNVLRCQSLAEDAVHTAFARLVQLRHPPREPKLYAFRAVRNASIDAARVRTRRREEPIFPAFNRAIDDASHPWDESLAELTRALKQLDEASREVVELHLHADLAFREIANILDEPLPTVASRYRRALLTLRQILEVHHE